MNSQRSANSACEELIARTYASKQTTDYKENHYHNVECAATKCDQRKIWSASLPIDVEGLFGSIAYIPALLPHNKQHEVASRIRKAGRLRT